MSLVALRGRHGWQFGVLGAFLTLVIFLAFLGLGVAEVRSGVTPAPPVDFVVFWGAAKLAASGEWTGAFVSETLRAAHAADVEEWFPWAYPPGLLLLLMPLGALSFATAWIVFSAVSLVAFALAVRPFDGRILPVWLAFAFAPACLPALLLGQLTLLWMAGMLAALAAMRSGRPVLAGLLIGCLTLKPQLGLLIPVVLLASRQWTVIAAATVSALVVAGLPTLYFGTDCWTELARVGSAHFEFMKERAWEFHLMPSVYAELRKLGLSHAVGIGVQWTVAAGVGLVLWRAWSDPETSFDLRAAVLVSAVPLSTPYLWYYDAAFTALTALFLLRAGILQFSLPQFPVLALLWLGAGASCVVELMTPETVVPIRELTLPVMLLGFILAARAAAGGRSLAPQPA